MTTTAPCCIDCGTLLDWDGSCLHCAIMPVLDVREVQEESAPTGNVFTPGTPEHDAYEKQVAGELDRAAAELAGRLEDVRAVFRKWLGPSYDLGALDAVLATAAVERLDGDPTWLLIVSGSGSAKTETVIALAGVGAHVTSTITSEGALLSGASRKEHTKDATGGLLRKIGTKGLLVIKDFTTILSMHGDQRASVLAALREVYDGKWERNVGVDGGRTLTWVGRIVLIGAVTTAYDSAHAVVAAMGDRFALVRIDSATGRMDAGRQALANVSHEEGMRAELSASVAALLTGMVPARAVLSKEHQEVLLGLADVVTLARTAVERDYSGSVCFAHAPEMPTRFAKMLGQIVRGGLALGMAPQVALATAVRVAGDSVPPLRLNVLADVARHPGATTDDVRGRVQVPRSTVDRELQALHLLGLLVQDTGWSPSGGGRRPWTYQLSRSIDTAVLSTLITRSTG